MKKIFTLVTTISFLTFSYSQGIDTQDRDDAGASGVWCKKWILSDLKSY